MSFERRMPMGPAAGDCEDYAFPSWTAVRVGLARVVALQASFPSDRDTSPSPGVECRDERSLGAGHPPGVK